MLELRFVTMRASGEDDAQTVVAISPPYSILEYVPQAAPESVTWTQGQREGAWPVDSSVENVTETIRLEVAAAAHDALDTFKQALAMARTWSKGARGDMRVVLQVRDLARHGDDWYEAQVFGGQVDLEDGRGRVLRMYVERAPYWSETEDRIMTLGNTGETDTVVTIYNHDDSEAAHDNWVVVEPPPGNVPALTRIRLRNTYNDPARLAEVRVGWYDRPHVLALEGESTELPAVLYSEEGLSNLGGAQASRFQWALPQADVQDYVGLFQVLANGSLSGQCRVSAGYEITAYQKGRYATGRVGWTDLGLMSMPPGGYVHPVRYPVRVWVDCGASSRLDFVQFVPAMQFRRWLFRGYNAQYSTCIVDDGIRDELIYEYGNQAMPVLDGYGERIMLYPAGLLPEVALPGGFVPGWTETRNQVLVFAMKGDTGDALAARSAEVHVTCRARWDTLP